MVKMISFEEGERVLDWIALSDALAEGHEMAPAEVADVFLYEGANTLLNRSAWSPDLGIAVKCATIFPGNTAAGKPAIGGAVNLFSPEDGSLEAILDFALVTKWKTAADSLLAARRLARPDSREILIVGSGTVAGSLFEAYGAAFPEARFTVWSRRRESAEAFAATRPGVAVAEELKAAVAEADIVTCATMSTEPVLKGAWLRPGQHIDLIGAYRPDMREIDDAGITAGRLFVDSRETTVNHIGELMIPMSSGVLDSARIVADFNDLAAFVRQDRNEITLFKNGGGAHLDLMTCRHILRACNEKT